MSTVWLRFAQKAREDDTSFMAARASCRYGVVSTQVWRGFAQAVPDFGVEVVEVIPAEGNTVVVQAVLGGTMPTDVPGFSKKGQIARYAHAFILRFAPDGKISHIDCYWDNFGTSFAKASAL